MDMSFGLMRSPQAILFGPGQRHAVGKVAGAIARRVLVCTDTRLAADPHFDALLASLRDTGIETLVFDGTQPELPIEGVYACAQQARAFAPQAVLGIGGGSCMDLAKLVSLLLAQEGGTLEPFYGELKVPGPVLPVIAIPTTSGTGSEITPVAVVADSKRDMKVGISSPHLIPHAAICDPELTLSCPPGLTAHSGADAMTHAIEAFTAVRREAAPGLAMERVFVGKNVLSDAHALTAISCLSRHLPRAVEDGRNLEARSGAMLGALHAGLAFAVAGTAAAHAIQYPVGALTHTPHGVGVAVLMPYVMAFNRAACTQEFAQIARAMGATGADDAALADAAITRVAALFERIGIPSSLTQLGLPAERAGWVAAQSMLAARLVTNNPRPLDEAAMARIIDAALAGQPSDLLHPVSA